MPSGTPNVTRKRVAYNESSSNTEASSRENKKKLLDELLADQQGVLDEQQQEMIIEQLKYEGEESNKRFKFFMSLLSSILFFFYLYLNISAQLGLLNTNNLFSSDSQHFQLFSIISALVFGICVLYINRIFIAISGISISTQSTATFVCAFVLSVTPPLLSFIYGNTSDLYWNMLWYMPLGMVLLNGYVVRMTLEVDDGVDLLQKAKYKYKGA